MRQDSKSLTRNATLSLLLKEGESTALSLASSIGVSVQAMRRQLRHLEANGLVTPQRSPSGSGRPSNNWKLTTKAIQEFPNSSENFLIDLINSIKISFPPETLDSILTNQSIDQAKTYRKRIGNGALAERLQKLIQLRNKEGYYSELKKDPNSESLYMNSFHCSILKVAEEHPSLCEKELQMMKLTFPDCIVERVKWRFNFDHYCGFRISPQQ